MADEPDLPLTLGNITLAHRAILRVFDRPSSQLEASIAEDALKRLVQQAAMAITARNRDTERLGKALEQIASQSTVGELEVAYGEGCTGDYRIATMPVDRAYDAIIGIARAALSHPTTEPAKAEESE
jgi:hypothetical protein